MKTNNFSSMYDNVINNNSNNCKPWDDNPDMVLDLQQYSRDELIEMLENCFDESEYLHEKIVDLEKQIDDLEEFITSRENEILAVLKRTPFPGFRKLYNLKKYKSNN